MTSQQITTYREQFQKEKVFQAKDIFDSLGDTRRFFIFRFLTQQTGACVSDIAAIFDISIPAASQHLKKLERSGLVVRIRYGQKICYEINYANSLVGSLVTIVRGT